MLSLTPETRILQILIDTYAWLRNVAGNKVFIQAMWKVVKVSDNVSADH